MSWRAGAGDFRLPEGSRSTCRTTARASTSSSRGRCAGAVRGHLCALPRRVHLPARGAGRHRAHAGRGGRRPTSGALREEDIGLAYYEGDEIDLTPLVHEQTLARPADPPAVHRGVSWAVLALRREPERRPVRLSRQRRRADGLAALQTLLRER